MSKDKLSSRQIEGYLKLAQIVQWGRKYPTRFVERFFGIELLDLQKYVFLKSWSTPFCLWCMSRNSGKTTLGSPFIMAKSLLIPNFQAYILAGVGSQSQEMFSKIEKIAKKEIGSFTGLTDIFYNETVKSAANKDGFTHNPASFEYKLYNASQVNSLNGAFDNNRSKRSQLNFYDESGFAPEELFTSSIPFTVQNSDFKLGGDVDVNLLPREFPNQLIFASSASSVDTYFFDTYREYAKKMFLGDNRYFVADINSDVVISATYNGKIYPKPLLTQETIDSEMKKNPEKAMREYGNIFTKEGGDEQIIKRAAIIRNSIVMPPTMLNTDNKRKFLFAYDPARSHDSSINAIAELVYDEQVGHMLKLSNVVGFKDVASKNKRTQMQYPEQRKLLQQLILDYNGDMAADYENIECVLIDDGSGGGGKLIADDLMADWTDSKGVKHKGLIDKEAHAEYLKKYPNAAHKVKMISFKKLKVEMYEALIEMMSLDLIKFPESYDGKGTLWLSDSQYKLSFDEELALYQIDLTKEELVNIHRHEGTNGNVRYDLPPHKEYKMGDDRADTMAMLAWQLQQIRRKDKHNRTPESKLVFLYN